MRTTLDYVLPKDVKLEEKVKEIFKESFESHFNWANLANDKSTYAWEALERRMEFIPEFKRALDIASKSEKDRLDFSGAFLSTVKNQQLRLSIYKFITENSFLAFEKKIEDRQNNNTKDLVGTTFLGDNNYNKNYYSFLFDYCYALVYTLSDIEYSVNKFIRTEFQKHKEDYIVKLLHQAGDIQDYKFEYSQIKFPIDLNPSILPLYVKG